MDRRKTFFFVFKKNPMNYFIDFLEIHNKKNYYILNDNK